MSENLSGGSSGEDLVPPPPRQKRSAPLPSPAPVALPAPRQEPVAVKTQVKNPAANDDLKLKKALKVNKPLTFKDHKKKD